MRVAQPIQEYHAELVLADPLPGVKYYGTEEPVPVGWEEEPVTLGIFSDDSTKVKAPAAANRF